jgi:hypothetical protein
MGTLIAHQLCSWRCAKLIQIDQTWSLLSWTWPFISYFYKELQWTWIQIHRGSSLLGLLAKSKCRSSEDPVRIYRSWRSNHTRAENQKIQVDNCLPSMETQKCVQPRTSTPYPSFIYTPMIQGETLGLKSYTGAHLNGERTWRHILDLVWKTWSQELGLGGLIPCKHLESFICLIHSTNIYWELLPSQSVR